MLLPTDRAGSMLVGTDDCAIDKVRAPVKTAVSISLLLECFKDALPYTGSGPSSKAAVDCAPRPEPLGDVSPRRAGAEDPEDGAEDRAMVPRGATRSRALGRKKRSEALPLRICKLNSFAPAVLPRFAHTP